MKFLSLTLLIVTSSATLFAQTYRMPHENERHEGTWLQWPHQYEYGIAYRNSLDATWVAMTKALSGGEKVHIIAYDNTEKERIVALLVDAGVALTNVDFFLFPTNDVWVRDNGPVFVRNNSGNLLIEDWGFNGWGGKFNYDLCNPIPQLIGTAIDIPIIDLNNTMINEGGAVEIDGGGVLMACKSSIISQSPANSIRNPGMTKAQAENIFAQYLGVEKFVWLNGKVGDPEDITDFHIDGFAKFLNSDTLITMNSSDLAYWGVPADDMSILYGASNVQNQEYSKVYLPLTQNNVVTTYGNNLGYKGSYVNYYVANAVVLVPNYSDPNDNKANEIIQSLYPDRTVVGIDCRNLYEWGGMVHCVTQQQPAAAALGINNDTPTGVIIGRNFPNPFVQSTSVNVSLQDVSDVSIAVFNSFGQVLSQQVNSKLTPGNHTLTLRTNKLAPGVYFYTITMDGKNCFSGKMVKLY